MATTLIFSYFAPFAFGMLCVFTVAYVWLSYNRTLGGIPGPFLAKYTDLWRLIDTYKGRCDQTQLALHRRYGSAVRLGPKLVSLSDPSLIRTVYGMKPVWKKSKLYQVNDYLVNGQRISTIFGTRDEDIHALLAKPVRPFYSNSAVRDLELLLDRVIDRFGEELEKRFAKGKEFDITRCKPFGFTEKGEDIDGFLSSVKRVLRYFAVISQMPWLDHLFDKNPIHRMGPPSVSWGFHTSAKAVVERRAEMEADIEKFKNKSTPDFLDKLFTAQEFNANFGDDNVVIGVLVINFVAGSDTTATTMNGAIYHILKNPAIHDRLVAELTNTELSNPVKWSETVSLKYLNAVVQEAIRVTPAIAMMLEREIPVGGVTLPDGQHIVEGNIIGMNAAVVQQNEDYFEADPESFIPERWLIRDGESEELYSKRVTQMKEGILTFDHGPRNCLGRNMSQMETFKLIATLFRRYELKLVHAKRDWKVLNSWFVYLKDVQATIKTRVN